MFVKSYQLVEHGSKIIVNACQDIHKALHHPWASPLVNSSHSIQHQVIVKGASEAFSLKPSKYSPQSSSPYIGLHLCGRGLCPWEGDPNISVLGPEDKFGNKYSVSNTHTNRRLYKYKYKQIHICIHISNSEPKEEFGSTFYTNGYSKQGCTGQPFFASRRGG